MELFDLDVYQDYKEKNPKSSLIDGVLKEKQIYMVYQPICCFAREEVYGYEGLSRTSNPSFSNILELINLAEMKDKLHELDLLMMEQVIRNFKGEGKLFVNAEGKSPEAITKFIEKMIHTAKEVGISMEDIVLELSERKKWSQESLYTIKSFAKKYKFLLAVDDFGMGFSDVSLLLDLQPDIVKIDRYLIQGIHNNPEKYSYIKLFVGFARKNNIRTICEGIEIEEEFEALRNLGSDYGQGYYLGVPE